VAPELVGMNGPVPADAAYSATGIVAFVHLEQFEHVGCARGFFPNHPEVYIRAVRVVVHGEHLFRLSPFVQVSGPVDDEVYGGAGLFVREIFFHQFASPPGIDQMIEAYAGDFVLFEKIEDSGNLTGVQPVHRKAEADLDPGVLAGKNAVHGFAEGAFHPSEPVVDLIEAVQADSDIGKAHFLEFGGHARRNKRSVRGNDRPHPLFDRVIGQFDKIGPDERLAAGKQDYGASEPGQVVEHALALCGSEFARKFLVFRMRITVNAFEVAAPGHIPDHDRFLVGGKLKEMGWQLAAFTSVAQGVGGFDRPAVKFRYAYHVGSRYVPARARLSDAVKFPREVLSSNRQK